MGPAAASSIGSRAGTYRIVGDGSAHVSRMHVADLAQAIVRAGERADVTGPINIADDAPDPIGLVADTLAERLGVAAHRRGWIPRSSPTRPACCSPTAGSRTLG